MCEKDIWVLFGDMPFIGIVLPVWMGSGGGVGYNAWQ